ncbi:MAG: hypothetical protein KKH49_01540, partial [Candidatus Omnitrophica bacterium]|nr:hypothetical protein [Candidatus Omnitrophota bacterium]
TANSNNRGIYLDSSSSNNLTSNTLLNNRHDLYNTGTTNTYSSNQFNHNLTSKTLTSAETTKTIDVNGIASFDISIFDPNGVACPDCSYTAVTSPSETVTATKNSNQVTGSFIPTKSGTYSLNFTVTDGSNTTKRRLLFFVGNTVSLATTYYFRGISPTHGQPYGTGKDSKTLLLTAPTSTETEFCGSWVQNFPDDIPNYPLANLSGIDTYSWYKQASGYSYIGIQRYGTYDPNIDPGKSQLVSATSTYTWINKNFTGFNWTMDYSHNWYWLALKLYGSNTYWTTFPANEADADPASWAAHHHPDGSTDPSYADFTYQYTTTPAIKSIFDENIMVLSATADPSDTGIISIVLEDSLTSYTSTMDIVLSSPVRIDFSFDTWDPYYRQWTEEASEPGITATHIISGFAPNNYYVVNKDGALVGLYLSDGLGRITFTCLAGSVFSVMDMETVSGGGAEGGHCFIATATFGTPMASEVRVLSRFRDSYLLTNPIREGFVATYYKVSPRAALFIREHPVLKKAVRGALNPLIWLSRKAVK